MLSLRRSTLDTLLVRAAITSGAAYLDETLATVAAPAVRTEDVVRVELRHPRVAVQPAPQGMPPSQLLSARLVVVAAGLTRSPLGHRTEWPAEIVPGSRIGVQTLVPAELLERHAWSWDRELRLGNSYELIMLV